VKPRFQYHLILIVAIIVGVFSNAQGDPVDPAVKKFITPQELLEDSYRLGNIVFDSGFRPTFLISLWRGGAPIGIALTEYFLHKKAPIDKHISVRVSSYQHDQQKEAVEVFNLEYIIKNIEKNDRVLLVDDVLESGRSIQTLLKEMRESCNGDLPVDIRVATIYCKQKDSTIAPDYYLYDSDEWLVFPHELEQLTDEEIRTHKGEMIADILKK